MDDHHRSVDFFEALHNFEEKNKALHIHGKNANFYWGRCCIFMKKITSVGQRRCLIMAKKGVAHLWELLHIAQCTAVHTLTALIFAAVFCAAKTLYDC